MLQAKHVYKNLGDFSLKNINFQINDGEYFVILGPTGSGKSVILQSIAGMYNPDRGSFYFGEKNLSSMYPEKREIGFVYQDYLLFPHLSVEENIIFGLKIKGISSYDIKSKLEKVSIMFKIEHLLQRFPKNLSGGEQQRVALARALITSPKILLMDEPFSALDPVTKEEFKAMVKNIHKDIDITIIHVTHDFDEALYLADRVAVIIDGVIQEIGTPEEIFKNPSSRSVARFVGVLRGDSY